MNKGAKSLWISSVAIAKVSYTDQHWAGMERNEFLVGCNPTFFTQPFALPLSLTTSCTASSHNYYTLDIHKLLQPVLFCCHTSLSISTNRPTQRLRLRIALVQFGLVVAG